MEFTDVFQGPLLIALGVVLSVVLLTPPVYYLWSLFASFRRDVTRARRPPIVCFGLWLLQWPFALLGMVGCLGGGCGGLGFNVVVLLCVTAYNLIPALWLLRHSRRRHPTPPIA
jgi:hypothetical protein